MIVSSVSPAVGAMLSAHQSIGVPQPLALFGTEEQKQRFLPRCARGEISAFLLTESDVGSDPARLGDHGGPVRGRLVPTHRHKLWTTNGVIADVVVVMASCRPTHRGGITAFIVEADPEGSPSPTETRSWECAGSRTGDPVRRRAGAGGQPDRQGGPGTQNRPCHAQHGPAVAAGVGRAGTLAAQDRAGVGAGADSVGQADRRARGDREEDRVHRGDGLRSRHDRRPLSRLADDKHNDIRIEAALAKLYCSEMAWLLADELVQVRGGRGYETAASLAARGERGVPAEQMLRDMRINRIFEGSSEIMRLFIAREAVDAHLAAAGGLIEPVSPRASEPGGGGPAPSTAAGCRPWSSVKGCDPARTRSSARWRSTCGTSERSSRKLARATFYGMARWQGRLERKQGFLGRIVDIGAELFAMSAVCVRAHDDPAAGLTDGAPDQEEGTAAELAAAFCVQARSRVEELFRQLWHNTDADDVRLARRVLSGRYSWLEAGIIDPSLPGPWVAAAEPGPSSMESVHRDIR